MRSIASSIALSAIVAALCTGTLAHADSFERTVPADARGEVEIINRGGDVQVRGWDRAEVQIHADVDEDDDERINVQSGTGRTSINVLRSGREGGSTDMIVQVPRESTVLIKTVSADQTITDVRGVQRLQSVSGSINTQVWGADISVRTISGDVTVAGHGTAASTEVNTVSGDVNLSNIAGDLNIETVTGDMQIRMPTLTRGRIQTTNGDLNISASLTADARLEAEAINGDLGFVFKSPINIEFDVETFNGEIDNCFGPKPVRAREFAPGNSLRFKEGTGSARVRVKTLNGGVEICR